MRWKFASPFAFGSRSPTRHPETRRSARERSCQPVTRRGASSRHPSRQTSTAPAYRRRTSRPIRSHLRRRADQCVVSEALENVRDIDVVARRADPASSFDEQLPGGADERNALLVLVEARRLADEHQVGVGRARAEHDLRTRSRARTRAAGGRVGVRERALAQQQPQLPPQQPPPPPKLGCPAVP